MLAIYRQTIVCAAFLLFASTAWCQPMQDAEADIRAGRYSTALAKILPAARAGDPMGQYLLVSLYLNGNGVSKDTDEALKWLVKSADQGYARAQSDLGAFYLMGRHVTRDTERGAELLLKAARQGEPGAFYDLGVMYRDGLGVQKDVEKAKVHFLTAAAKRHALAQYGLARMSYDEGDFKEAARWYEKAGDQGDLKALYNLGYMYHEGQGVARDYKKANALFLRVADQGRFEQEGSLSYKAMDMLGDSYRYGQGVSQDYVEAYKWYVLAAARGHPNATAQMQEVARFMTESHTTEAKERAKRFAEGKGDNP